MQVVCPGCEIDREKTARHVRRHHHVAAYGAVVLRGSYVEAGDRGRFRVGPGDVLFHESFESHQDHFARGGADILNLPLHAPPAMSAGRIGDPDSIVRAAAGDLKEAAALLIEQLKPGSSTLDDWPDLLAESLRTRGRFSVGEWAEDRGLAPSTVSRGFRRAYGISPKRYRLEVRAGMAARAISRGTALAEAALAAGFADQPHMTHAVRQCFGRSPATLRP